MKKFRVARKNVEKCNGSEKEMKHFYSMLLKFKKHHPAFDAKRLFQKLYPNSGIRFNQ